MKIAIISASGIGNTILFTPALAVLKKRYPTAIVDMIVMKEVFADCVKGSGLLNDIYCIPSKPVSLIRFILSIRNNYDATITVFPSNKWQFNLFAYLIGAKMRITHGYVFGKIRTLSFLQNHKVAADPALHDVYQNLNLLKTLFIQSTEDIPPVLFHLSAEDKQFAIKYYHDNKIGTDDFVIGVHAGAGPLGDRKKWGISNFARELNGMIRQNPSSVVILFGGKEETEEREQLLKELDTERVKLFNGTLKQTAALISRCNFFLSNDTGLMHVAACFGIKQESIFLSTNPTRTSPFNKNATVQIEGDCTQYKYPFWSTK